MIRFWLSLIFVAAAGFAAVWLANHPGDVVIHWFGYRIETSLAFLLLVAVTGGWLLVYAYAIFRDIAAIPKRFADEKKLRHYHEGLAELTYSVAALAASNLHGAEKHAYRAQKLLGQTPMGLLISAQIAKNNGNEEEARALLQRMLDYKETRDMAERLLTDQSGMPAPSKMTRLRNRIESLFKRNKN
jgi:HemY protein